MKAPREDIYIPGITREFPQGNLRGNPSEFIQ